ncbi:MAG TPA: glycosyltransferase family 4 protein [Candidatus Sulfotelmatobacter sp.]
MRLAILSTHPIQYHSPWFRALGARPELNLRVYYCHQATSREQANAGFGVEFDWDVPLLEGYRYTFLKNIADSPGHGRFNGFDTPEIKEIIRRREYDAVLVNGWHYKSAWQAIWACWKSKVKVMARGDSHLHSPRGIAKRAVKSFAYRGFIPRFDACLAVGQWSREYFLHYGARPGSIFLVPHAIDNENFRNEAEILEPRRSELRKERNLGENAIVFAFSGKFIPKKRPMDFVCAIERAARRNPRIEGLMVGDGPLYAECENFVRQRRIPVRFTGFLNQSQITKAYVVSDALVLPSDGGETWGLVVNEAMACARPCIVSDRVGCGPDLVIPRETGSIFPLGNVEALTNSMLELGTIPGRMVSMGIDARNRLANYSVETAVDGVINSLTATLNPQILHASA